MLHTEKVIPYIKNRILKQYQKYTTHSISKQQVGIGLFFSLLQVYLLVFQIPKLLSIIWPYLLQNYSTTIIYVTGAFIANLATLITYNLILMVIYKLKHPFFEQYKVWDKPWPWQENYQKWRELLRKSIIQLFMNSFVWGPLFVLSTLYLFPMNFDFKAETIPSGWTILWQFLFFVFFQDLGTYMTHSALHHPLLYWIHKRHHQYTMSVSIATIYAHPLQFIFSNVIPTGIGMTILMNYYPVHVITGFLWIVFRIYDSHDGHCGYSFPWRLGKLMPFCNDDDYHNYHHSHNVGNIEGTWGFWDRIFGTDYGYEEYKKKKEQKRLQREKLA